MQSAAKPGVKELRNALLVSQNEPSVGHTNEARNRRDYLKKRET
jgi:hypothetical protein